VRIGLLLALTLLRGSGQAQVAALDALMTNVR
jgi:hypothetical protein